MEKIIDQGKDREIIYQLPARAKQCQQLPVKIHLDSEKQNEKYWNSTVTLPFPRLSFTPLPVQHPCPFLNTFSEASLTLIMA